MPRENWMFKLRGAVSLKQRFVFGLIGFMLVFLLWVSLTMGDNPVITSGILPKPISDCKVTEVYQSYTNDQGLVVADTILNKNTSVVCAYPELVKDNNLIGNLCLSLGFNFGGYIKAILLSLLIGFLIGLFPIFSATFEAQVNAIRFIPLTAVTSIFIAIFSLNASIKINFLAFGIMIYLIPIVIQRIKEVKDVYLKTVYTIGANKWQTITSVYLPSVLSRLSDDIRVLTAISWTYIIVAEGIGDQGGLGSLIFRAGQRMGRPDKVFAVLLLFVLIGIIQDRIFVLLDRKFFPHKYQQKNQYQDALKTPGIWDNIRDFALKILAWIILSIYAILTLNEIIGFFGAKLISHLFQDTAWTIHLIFIGIITYKVVSFINQRKMSAA